MGVSEISDAVVVVVSEETGIISIALEGKMNRRITPDALSAHLKKYLNKEDFKKRDIFSIWKNRKDASGASEEEKKEEAGNK